MCGLHGRDRVVLADRGVQATKSRRTEAEAWQLESASRQHGVLERVHRN